MDHHSSPFPSCPPLHGIHLPLPLSLFTKLRKLTLCNGISLVTNGREAVAEDAHDEGGGERPAKHVPSPLHALRGTALSAVEAREQHTEMLQAERRRTAQQQENQRLRRRVARVKREAAEAKLLYAGAEEAKVRLRPRHDAECARVRVSNVLCPPYLA